MKKNKKVINRILAFLLTSILTISLSSSMPLTVLADGLESDAELMIEKSQEDTGESDDIDESGDEDEISDSEDNDISEDGDASEDGSEEEAEDDSIDSSEEGSGLTEEDSIEEESELEDTDIDIDSNESESEDNLEFDNEVDGYIPDTLFNAPVYKGVESYSGAMSGLVKDDYSKSRSASYENVKGIDETLSVPEAYPVASSNKTDLTSYLKNRLPDNRNQNPYGTCWAHSAIGLSEFYMLTHGIDNTTKDVNYSELHLAYFTYHNGTNPLMSDSGDSITFTGNWLQYGGNLSFAGQNLMRRRGVVSENDVPYSTAASVLSKGLNDSTTYENQAYLKNYFSLNKENRTLIKQAIKQNGAVGCSYCNADQFFDEDSEGYSNYYCNGNYLTNHAVMIVGWDDNYSRDNFKIDPGMNGAWLIRNSWNYSGYPLFSEYNYFWMSYADKSLNNIYVYEMTSEDGIDNLYSYNTQTHNTSYIYSSSKYLCANVYTASASDIESLKSVILTTPYRMDNVKYKIYVYKNLTNASDPMSGTLCTEATTSGTMPFVGEYTIDLAKKVELQRGQKFSIIVEIENTINGYYPTISYESPISASNGSSGYSATTHANDNESFMRYTSGGLNGVYSYYPWQAITDSSGNKYNFCIDALTCDVKLDPQEVTVSDFSYGLQSAVYDGNGHRATLTQPSDYKGTLTYEYTPIVNGTPDDSSWSATLPVNVGDYAFRVSGTKFGKYLAFSNLTSSNWIFTINPAALKASNFVIDESKKSFEYNAQPHTGVLSATGFTGTLTYQYAPVVSGRVGIYTTTVPTEVGIYQMKISGTAAGNYAAFENFTDTKWRFEIYPCKATSISIDGENELWIPVGTSTNLEATISPTYTSNKDVTWSSDNTNVASVTPKTGDTLKATVLCNRVGDTTITVTTKDGSNKSDSVIIHVFKGGWVRTDGYWKYQIGYESDGSEKFATNDWFVSGKNIYYLDDEGRRTVGMMDVPELVYDANGTATHGTNTYTYFFNNSTGALKTGFVKDDGRTYYFDPAFHNGAMKTGVATIGKAQYCFASEDITDTEFDIDIYKGEMLTGWVKTGSNYSFYSDKGVAQSGWINATAPREVIKAAVTSGTIESISCSDAKAKRWYYLESAIDGAVPTMVTGLKELNGNGYYLVNTASSIEYGSRLSSESVEINGTGYHFDKDGKLITGWYSFTDENGNKIKRYYTLNGINNYAYLKGVQVFTNGDTMYFDPATGAMKTGWVKAGDDYYYFAANGAMKKDYWIYDTVPGSQSKEIKSIYLRPDGRAALNTIAETNMGIYHIDENGDYTGGNVSDNDGNEYLFDDNGKAVIGWYYEENDGQKYYYGTDGKMAKGWKSIDGRLYFFDDQGRMSFSSTIGSGANELDILPDGMITSGEDAFISVTTDDSGNLSVEKGLTGNVGDDNNLTYYIDKDGEMKSGWVEVDGNRYYLDEETGALVTGFRQIGSNYYYFGNDGKMVSFANGAIVTVTNAVGEEVNYYVGDDGVLQSGWKKVAVAGEQKATWHYFGKPDNLIINIIAKIRNIFG